VRAAASVLLAVVACAPRIDATGAPRAERLELGTARVQVLWWPGDDGAAAQVRAALPAAIARATRFGPLAAPVTITIHPTHAALEAAVGREGFEWLHAWARYASVDLQSPRTWSRSWLFGATDGDVAELLAHELAHCAMYQRAGTEWGWAYQKIPLWFREGLASVAAGQGSRGADLRRLARFYREEARAGAAARDPLGAPEALYRTHWEEVYGAAHHAFDHLLVRHGEAKVARLLDVMGADGLAFPEAFERVVGISDRAFVEEFRGYVTRVGSR
jgi:hypothetical protein